MSCDVPVLFSEIYYSHVLLICSILVTKSSDMCRLLVGIIYTATTTDESCSCPHYTVGIPQILSPSPRYYCGFYPHSRGNTTVIVITAVLSPFPFSCRSPLFCTMFFFTVTYDVDMLLCATRCCKKRAATFDITTTVLVARVFFCAFVCFLHISSLLDSRRIYLMPAYIDTWNRTEIFCLTWWILSSVS